MVAYQHHREASVMAALETQETLNPRVYEFEGSNIIDKRFQILGGIGGGAYGTVYKAKDRNTGSIVALKKVSIMEDSSTDLPQLLIREVANLRRLKSPHIVRLLDVHESDGRYQQEIVWYMVFEHMEQDLDQFIKSSSSTGMHELVIKDFLGQILLGVDVMHENRIVHRDLKPQNILVSSDGRKIKIADLGLSRQIGQNVVLSTQVVTQWYRAPEVLLYSSYCESVDMWSIGCIFAEMLTGRPCFATNEPGEKPQLQQIFKIIGTPKEPSWPSHSQIDVTQFDDMEPQPWTDVFSEATSSAIDLLSKLLKFEASMRITAQEAIQHEYLNSSSHSDGTPQKV